MYHSTELATNEHNGGVDDGDDNARRLNDTESVFSSAADAVKISQSPLGCLPDH